ncbi:hypothetical protein N9D73_01765 [Planktomarina temperata]|nr:hypothetical protein [Planktomarina temperata]
MQKITPDCPTVQKKVEEFFLIAIQRNEKSCAKLKWSACGQYDVWAQNLYEAAVKNGNKSFASTIKKYSSYVRNDTKAKEAAKKKAAEDAKKKAAEEAAIIKGAAEVTLQMLEKYRSKTELQLNTQTYIDENGNKGTLWCNPGPCTPASALKHGWISGAGTFLPLDLVEAVTEAVTTDIETIDAPGIRSKIFDITLKTFKGAAETSNDSNLKSAAAMTTAQIKLNQEANEKSQEDRNDTPVVETEAPVGDPESAMVVGMNPP